ncbi:hypothetical protein GW17_00037966 [Ensete ventricosum]|nr:hypothetical protein GW17_00037966 [Ensete ventricosum]
MSATQSQFEMKRLGLTHKIYIAALVGSIESTNANKVAWFNSGARLKRRRVGSGERPGDASLKHTAWRLSEVLGPRLPSPERLGERPSAFLNHCFSPRLNGEISSPLAGFSGRCFFSPRKLLEEKTFTFAISIFTARYERYIPVRQVAARRCRPRVAGALSPARGERLRRPVYTVYRPVPVPYRYQDELGIGMANPLRERHHKDKQARKNTYAQRLGWLSSSYSLTLATKFDDAQGKRRA